MHAHQLHPADLLEDLARRFDWHEKHIYGNSAPLNLSPLYARFAFEVVADPDTFVVAPNADGAQQVPDLLFGAVHFLLLGGMHHFAADCYPDLCALPRSLEEVYPSLCVFCLDHEEEIEQLATTRWIQTSELRRCACLLPAFGRALQSGQAKPFMLIEIGSSTGLNLLWDHHVYDYGRTNYIEDPTAIIQFHLYPQLLRAFPNIVQRVGIDLVPVDVRDEMAKRCLQTLVWLEHRDCA